MVGKQDTLSFTIVVPYGNIELAFRKARQLLFVVSLNFHWLKSSKEKGKESEKKINSKKPILQRRTVLRQINKREIH